VCSQRSVDVGISSNRQTERDRERQTDTSALGLRYFRAVGAWGDGGEVKEEDSCDEELEGAETAALLLARMKNVLEAPNFERPGVLLDADEQVLTEHVL